MKVLNDLALSESETDSPTKSHADALYFQQPETTPRRVHATSNSRDLNTSEGISSILRSPLFSFKDNPAAAHQPINKRNKKESEKLIITEHVSKLDKREDKGTRRKLSLGDPSSFISVVSSVEIDADSFTKSVSSIDGGNSSRKSRPVENTIKSDGKVKCKTSKLEILHKPVTTLYNQTTPTSKDLKSGHSSSKIEHTNLELVPTEEKKSSDASSSPVNSTYEHSQCPGSKPNKMEITPGSSEGSRSEENQVSSSLGQGTTPIPSSTNTQPLQITKTKKKRNKLSFSSKSPQIFIVHTDN